MKHHSQRWNPPASQEPNTLTKLGWPKNSASLSENEWLATWNTWFQHHACFTLSEMEELRLAREMKSKQKAKAWKQWWASASPPKHLGLSFFQELLHYGIHSHVTPNATIPALTRWIEQQSQALKNELQAHFREHITNTIHNTGSEAWSYRHDEERKKNRIQKALEQNPWMYIWNRSPTFSEWQIWQPFFQRNAIAVYTGIAKQEQTHGLVQEAIKEILKKKKEQMPRLATEAPEIWAAYLQELWTDHAKHVSQRWFFGFFHPKNGIKIKKSHVAVAAEEARAFHALTMAVVEHQVTGKISDTTHTALAKITEKTVRDNSRLAWHQQFFEWAAWAQKTVITISENPSNKEQFQAWATAWNNALPSEQQPSWQQQWMLTGLATTTSSPSSRLRL